MSIRDEEAVAEAIGGAYRAGELSVAFEGTRQLLPILVFGGVGLLVTADADELRLRQGSRAEVVPVAADDAVFRKATLAITRLDGSTVTTGAFWRPREPALADLDLLRRHLISRGAEERG